MSETVTYQGKLTLIAKKNDPNFIDIALKSITEDSTLSLDVAKQNLADENITLEEYIRDTLEDQYVFIGDSLYKVESKSLDIERSIFEGTKNSDGSISYIIQYYNGGCSFAEALGKVIGKLND